MTTHEVLSQLVHGPSKAGKSTYSFTGPFPLCALDAEGSTKFIKTAGFNSTTKIRKIGWNPLAEAPPRHDGSWDVCVVNVPDWATMKNAYDHLRISPHDFRSLSLDSITEVQRKCKRNIKSGGQLMQQDWGALLFEMDNLIRGYRDLLLLPNTLEVVTFIAETRMKDGKWCPTMEGAIAANLPYWVDICGYFYQEKDASGVKRTNMLVTNHPQYEAGERVQGRLPDIVAEPNITQILQTVYA